MLKGISSLKGRHFLSTSDLSYEEFHQLIELGVAAKQEGRSSFAEPLKSRGVGLVFFDPSLRTRASMIMAISELGGTPVPLEIGGGTWSLEHRSGIVMDGNKTEHVKEAVPVLGQYVSAIGVRCFPALKNLAEDRRDEVLHAFREFSTVPIINLESSVWHPCQALADMMTIRERYGYKAKKKVTLVWANHPKVLPHAVPNSFALAAVQCGHDVTIAAPSEYLPDEASINMLKKFAHESGARIRTTSNQDEAYDGSDVIYAKSWASTVYYGHQAQDLSIRQKYLGWMVTERKMQQSNNGIFMHCLPVRRNVVVEDQVLDGLRSVVVEEAGNRLHMQKALLASILGS